MLTAKQVGALLGVSLSKVYDLASSGRLVCYRFDGAVRFELADVEAFKAACRVVVAPPLRARFASVTMRASDPGGESELSKHFRKLGIKPRGRAASPARRAQQPEGQPIKRLQK